MRLSRDGRQLFVTAMVNRREEVLRRGLDQLTMAVIPGAGQGDQGTGNSRPFVSPDGRWVAYATSRSRTGPAGGQDGTAHAAVRGPYPDNPGYARPRSYDAARDGERFLMLKLPGEQPDPRDGGGELVRRASCPGASVAGSEWEHLARTHRTTFQQRIHHVLLEAPCFVDSPHCSYSAA